MSPSRSWEAEYTWSGTVRDPVGPPSYASSIADRMMDWIFPWTAARYEGHYWTDIYDVRSGKRLIQIRGVFHRESPAGFQGRANWFASRFYVMPLEANEEIPLTLRPEGMRRLLICDVQAAATAKGESDSINPVTPLGKYSRSSYQTRLLEPETQEAKIVGLHDEPVFRPNTNTIEGVNVSAAAEVRVPAEYTLDWEVAGTQNRVITYLSSGIGDLTLLVPAARLRALGVNGPYRIKIGRLTRQAGDGEVLSFDPAITALIDLGFSIEPINGTTRAYSLADLSEP